MAMMHKELEKLEGELQSNPIEGVVFIGRQSLSSDCTGTITLSYLLAYRGEKRRLDIVAYDEDTPTAHIELFNDLLGKDTYHEEVIRNKDGRDMAVRIRRHLEDLFRSLSSMKSYGK